jgi:hypothetical protein
MINFERLSEPSTWASLTGMLTIAGVSLGGLAEPITFIAAGISGLLGVFLKEAK